MGFVLLAGVAWASTSDRTAPLLTLVQKLNGSPLSLGAVFKSIDGGAFSTCINTVTPKDAGIGDLVIYSCSDPVFARGGDCSTAATSISHPLAANTDFVSLLTPSEMAIAFLQQDGGSSATCYVGHLK